jgi:hypothetical protein
LTHVFPPHWRAEQASSIIYKLYPSTEFTLNQYNEFGRGSIVFSSNSVCTYALYKIKKKMNTILINNCNNIKQGEINIKNHIYFFFWWIFLTLIFVLNNLHLDIYLFNTAVLF